jgi:hypothetical protein
METGRAGAPAQIASAARMGSRMMISRIMKFARKGGSHQRGSTKTSR